MAIPAVAAAGAGVSGAAAGGRRDSQDPVGGRVHVFRKPISPLVLALSTTLGAALVGGGAYLLTRNRQFASMTSRVGVPAAAAVAGAATGALLASFGDGPKVGYVVGQNKYFVKTGEETYMTTCTHTVTDSDGTSRTHSYPCMQVRDVGYHDWFDAQGELNLGRRKGSAEGYASLEQAINATKKAGTRNELAFVRSAGRVHVYELDPDGPERKDRLVPTDGSIIAYTDLDDTLHVGPGGHED